MCGILGYTGQREATGVLLDGLTTLEFRGYDSTGLCVTDAEGTTRFRSVGGVDKLRELIAGDSPIGTTGIGHTRWATHGAVTPENAHPFMGCDGRHTLALNGIIENHAALRAELISAGHTFESETDAEVIVHLLEELAGDEGDLDLAASMAAAAPRLHGKFAIVATDTAAPHQIVAMRRGAPLVVGLGADEAFISSTVTAFGSSTSDVVSLEDGQIARLTPGSVSVTDLAGRAVVIQTEHIDFVEDQVDRAGYSTFMLKEIHEQPRALRNSIDAALRASTLGSMDLTVFDKALIIGCGTSLHAGEVGASMIEEWAKLPTSVVAASEWRQQATFAMDRTLVIAMSQSGETADTIEALRRARELGAMTIGVTNSPSSQITREAAAILPTLAGLEVSVAATKTFGAQVVALAVLALGLAEQRATLSVTEVAELTQTLTELPELAEQCIASLADTEKLSASIDYASYVIFLGRNQSLATCREGALKLSEITYVPGLAWSAGEMKHGPIALIEPGTTVVCVTSAGPMLERTMANVAEVQARGASVVTIFAGDPDLVESQSDLVVAVPTTHPLLQPVLSVIPLQLLAHGAAERRGLNVDRPRNLAKTVTVE